MKVRYDGPFDKVDIPALGLVVEQGDTFDVDSDDAAALSFARQADFGPGDDEAETFHNLVAEADAIIAEPTREAIDDAKVAVLDFIVDDQGLDVPDGLKAEKAEAIAEILVGPEPELIEVPDEVVDGGPVDGQGPPTDTTPDDPPVDPDPVDDPPVDDPSQED